jgi:hypothetical protein
MDRSVPTSKLLRAAEFLAARRKLRVSGMWSVLFGVVSVMVGCLWIPVDWVLTALGVVLMATGGWNILVPRPTSIVLDAVAVLLVGAYNLIGAVLAVMDGLPPSPGRAFLGAFQVVWSVQRLGNLREFAGAFLERPTDAEIKEIDEAVGSIRRAVAKGSSDVIEFSAGTTRRAWKARLHGEHAVFVAVATSEFLVGTRGTIVLTPRSNESGGGALQADLAIGGTRLRITIVPDSLRLYEQWKAGTPASRPAAA